MFFPWLPLNDTNVNPVFPFYKTCHFEYFHGKGTVLSEMTSDYGKGSLFSKTLSFRAPSFSGARNLIALCLYDFSVVENIIIHAKRMKAPSKIGFKFDVISSPTLLQRKTGRKNPS
jgi:hypothetical protein